MSEGVEKGSTAVWRRILEDPEVQAWHDKLATRSTLTAGEYARVLHRYCAAIETTPAAIIERAKDQDGGRRAVHSQLQDFVVRILGRHKPSDHGEEVTPPEANKSYYEGRMHGGTVIQNFYDTNRDDLRRELARFGL
jgi:hypothetical protein